MCYLFNARFVTFSNQQIDSVLNGDATIDYVRTELDSDSDTDEGEIV